MIVTFTVPELRTCWLASVARAFLSGPIDGETGRGWYTAYRAMERAEQEMLDAQWRLACASWRWVRWSARPDGPDDDFWWVCETAIAARRFLIMGLLSHYPPGKALALRTPTEVAR